MKWITVLLLQASVNHAAAVRPRSPQDVPATAAPGKPKGLGPLGMDLTMLQGFDLAKFGPMLASMQPFLKNYADSGQLSNLANVFIPTLPLKNKVVLQAEIRKSAKRVKSRLGPITLVGKGQKKPFFFSPGSFISLDPNGQSFVSLYSADSLCTNCTILAGKTGLEFEDGTPADPAHGVYIHHILSADISRSGYLTVLPCDFPSYNLSANPISPIVPGAPFIGQGEDNGDSHIMFTSRDGTYDSGFKVGRNDRFIVQSDLVNYNDDAKQVYITIDFEYVDGHVGEEVAPNLLSVTGCKLLEPKISPDGPIETDSQVFPILVDGTIISMKGHLHNGGERIMTYLNGKEICTSHAEYDNANIAAMTACDKPIKVKKGDIIRLKSVYDIVKHPMRKSTHGGHSQDIIGGHDLMAMVTMSIAIDK